MNQFLNIHHAAHALLIGSGPSLSAGAAHFDELAEGAIVCAINEVALDLPRVDYVFANDPQSWVGRLPAAAVFFHPRRTPRSGELVCTAHAFDDAADGCRLTDDAATLARRGLYADEGTINSTLQVLHVMGVQSIHCVGIDGDRPPYARIRRRFEVHAARLGIALSFEAAN